MRVLPALMPMPSSAVDHALAPAEQVQREEDPQDERDRRAPALEARAGAERHAHHVHGEPDQQQQRSELHRDVHDARGGARGVQQAVGRGEDQQDGRIRRHDPGGLARAGCAGHRARPDGEVRPQQPGDPPAERDRRGDDGELQQAGGSEQPFERVRRLRPVASPSRSGVEVRDQLALEPRDLVLEHQLALLEAPHLHLVDVEVELQAMNHVVEVTVLDAQLAQPLQVLERLACRRCRSLPPCWAGLESLGDESR